MFYGPVRIKRISVIFSPHRFAPKIISVAYNCAVVTAKTPTETYLSSQKTQERPEDPENVKGNITEENYTRG